jgi:quercetin dioxygenase-like cupin family protein
LKKENVKIIRKSETKNFMEGDEYCKLYVETDKIVFGVSTLPPGRRGDVDRGHKDAYEIFYVVKGKVLCNLPDENIYEELEEGDVILIPPPRPHALINVGENTAIIVWSQAKF